MSDSFLSSENACGQHLLKLTSRASAIISELLRLSEHIPSVFHDRSAEQQAALNSRKGSPQPRATFNDLVCDFRYFKIQDEFEKMVQATPERLELDDKFRESNLPILERFYILFDSIYGYAQELERFVVDMKEGVYISQTFESILINSDGKQLLAESFYLYGVMLLLMEWKIDGRVRERMLISFLRYKGRGEVNDKVCQMCASTGFHKDMKRFPPGYPEEYFSRVKIPTDVISLVIGRMRSDDIYNMVYNYPMPDHRSTALSHQAAMVYVMLYFLPDVLNKQGQVMREIVYKHFNDNWVIMWYMGFTADVTYAWQNYPAASASIAEAITLDNVTYVAENMQKSLEKLNPEVEGILREGVLTEQYALDNIQTMLLPVIRSANVTLRWYILHTTRGAAARRTTDTMKKHYEIVHAHYNHEMLLSLLLNVAQLEFVLRTMFDELIKTKRKRWNQSKEKCTKKMTTLATYFSGEHALSDGVKETQLQEWFSDIANRIEELDYKDSTMAGRKIQKLMDALTDVQEFHQINSNMQVMQFLQETRHMLKQMVRYVNIERKVLFTIMTVGDLSYAWELMNVYNLFVKDMQVKIRRKPHLVMQMRSTFLKLSTLLELPLTRIAQAASTDELLAAAMTSVSEYYSTQLVAFVRKVLHVIPVTIFEKLKDIVKIQVSMLKECETKLQKDKIKEVAQLDVRARYAMTTSEIAKFADGILAMERTLMGVIHIEPQRLLEEGVRRELVDKISHELHRALRFDEKKPLTIEDLDGHLQELGVLLNGMRTSLEYIQDYIGVYGLKTWQEEYSRIINFNIDMECNQFMLHFISHWQSQYQSDTVPIPYFETRDDVYGFLGRLMKGLLTLTDARRFNYIHHLGSWYDMSGKVWREVVGPRLFSRIHNSVATQGLNGLDRLFCFLIAKDIKASLTRIRKVVAALSSGNNNRLSALLALLAPYDSLPKDAPRYYHEWTTVKLDFADYLTLIGRAQLIRRLIANELRFSAKLSSSCLFKSVTALNQSILSDVHAHYQNPTEVPYPAAAVSSLTPYVDACGMSQVFTKIYVTSEPLPELSAVLFVQLLRTMNKFTYDDRVDALLPKKRGDEPLDAVALVLGMLTLIQQFHRGVRDNFFGLLTQYVRVVVVAFDTAEKKVKDREVVPDEALCALHFLDLFAWALEMPLEDLAKNIPPHIITRFKSMPMNRK